MKITIKRYTAVAAWRWTGVEFDDLCGICRRQFDATCPECKYPGEACPLIFGTCGHAFHNHCLNTWLSGLNANNEPNTKCPMCRAQFVKKPAKADKETPQPQQTLSSPRMARTRLLDSVTPEHNDTERQDEDDTQMSNG